MYQSASIPAYSHYPAHLYVCLITHHSYWPYTQSSIVSEVLEGYRNYSIPLNNLVFDME